MSLLSLFDLSLIGRSTQPAILFDLPDHTRAELTFGELEQRSNRLAHVLRGRGLGAGDRVAFFLVNRIEIIELWIAGVKLGLILVPINVLYRERELRHIISDAAPTAVITSRDLAPFLPEEAVVWEVEELSARAASESTTRIATPCDAATPLSLIYTSGTTGASKGAVLTQGNF